MKTKKLLNYATATFASAIMAVGCSDNNLSAPSGEEDGTVIAPENSIVFSVKKLDNESKTYFNGLGSKVLVWSKNDALGFFAESAQQNGGLGKADIFQGEGQEKGIFVGGNSYLPGNINNLYVFYPYNQDVTYSDSKTKGHKLASAQTTGMITAASGVETSAGSYQGVASNIAQYGFTADFKENQDRAAGDVAMSLDQQVAYIEVYLDSLSLSELYQGKKVDNVTFEIEGGSDITGTFDIDYTKIHAAASGDIRTRGVTNVTGGSKSVSVSVSGNNVIGTETIPANAPQARVIIPVLPTTSKLTAMKVKVTFAGETVYYAMRKELDIALQAGKKYMVRLSQDASPAAIEFQDIYLFWSNDDTYPEGSNGTAWVDIHQKEDYPFSLGSITANCGYIWIQLNENTVFNYWMYHGNSKWPTTGVQVINSTLIRLSEGVTIPDVQIKLKASARSAGEVPIKIYTENPSTTGAVPSQIWKVYWYNRVGYGAQVIGGTNGTPSFDFSTMTKVDLLSEPNKNNKGGNGNYEVDMNFVNNGGKVGVSENPAIPQINVTTSTPLNTREAAFTTTYNGRKAKVYVQQNAFAIATSPIKVATVNGKQVYSFNGSDSNIVLFRLGSVVGLEPAMVSATSKYYVPDSNGYLTENTHPGWNTDALQTVDGISNPCDLVYPAHTWRDFTDQEALFLKDHCSMVYEDTPNAYIKATFNSTDYNISLGGVIGWAGAGYGGPNTYSGPSTGYYFDIGVKNYITQNYYNDSTHEWTSGVQYFFVKNLYTNNNAYSYMCVRN